MLCCNLSPRAIRSLHTLTDHEAIRLCQQLCPFNFFSAGIPRSKMSIAASIDEPNKTAKQPNKTKQNAHCVTQVMWRSATVMKKRSCFWPADISCGTLHSLLGWICQLCLSVLSGCLSQFCFYNVEFVLGFRSRFFVAHKWMLCSTSATNSNETSRLNTQRKSI